MSKTKIDQKTSLISGAMTRMGHGPFQQGPSGV